MKRTTSIILVLLVSFLFISCGKNQGPEKMIAEFSEAMKSFDSEKMKSCIINNSNSDDTLDESNKIMESLSDTLKNYASTLTYKIVDSSVDGDEAKVTVNYEYADASELGTAIFQEYMAEAFSISFFAALSEEYSDDDFADRYADLLDEKAKSFEPKRKETSVIYHCAKTDDGWKIADLPTEAMNVMTADMYRGLIGLAESFAGSEVNDSSDEESADSDIIEDSSMTSNEELGEDLSQKEPVEQDAHLRLIDNANLLTESEARSVLYSLDSNSEWLQFDIVIATTDSLDGKSIESFAEDCYYSGGYGFGDNLDGCLFLLDMENLQYYIEIYGDAAAMFTEDEYNELELSFIDELSEDDYCNAFLNFINGITDILLDL